MPTSVKTTADYSCLSDKDLLHIAIDLKKLKWRQIFIKYLNMDLSDISEKLRKLDKGDTEMVIMDLLDQWRQEHPKDATKEGFFAIVDKAVEEGRVKYENFTWLSDHTPAEECTGHLLIINACKDIEETAKDRENLKETYSNLDFKVTVLNTYDITLAAIYRRLDRFGKACEDKENVVVAVLGTRWNHSIVNKYNTTIYLSEIVDVISGQRASGGEKQYLDGRNVVVISNITCNATWEYYAVLLFAFFSVLAIVVYKRVHVDAAFDDEIKRFLVGHIFVSMIWYFVKREYNKLLLMDKLTQNNRIVCEINSICTIETLCEYVARSSDDVTLAEFQSFQNKDRHILDRPTSRVWDYKAFQNRKLLSGWVKTFFRMPSCLNPRGILLLVFLLKNLNTDIFLLCAFVMAATYFVEREFNYRTCYHLYNYRLGNKEGKEDAKKKA